MIGGFGNYVVGGQPVEKPIPAGKPIPAAKPVTAGYVDLGLPSGTLWKSTNETGGYQGFFTYDEAMQKFGGKLPTEVQYEELLNECTWTWTGKGCDVKGPNGNKIVLPAAGYRGRNGDAFDVEIGGHYWSATPIDKNVAWRLYFSSDSQGMYGLNRCYGRSVRLVQN